MSYYPHIDVMIMVAFLLTLVLLALVGTRRDKQRKRWACPPWLGVMTRNYYRLLHGYDPAMPDNWEPVRGTVVRRRMV